tara:strand:- start:17035 stop:17676 length:642 start_codon:yes stop_codon:yes gene_type:complete
MTATQLSLYNGALRALGERKLASLSEDRAPRRILDDIWNDGTIDACLEQGQWNFAMRTVKADYSPSVEPSFGLRRAFDKPVDWIRTSGLCSDEYFTNPLTQYRDEAGFWYADIDTIYVRFVSNHVSYGNDLSLWPESFVTCVELYMALEACEPITQSESKRKRVEKQLQDQLVKARSKDAMDEPPAFPPQGRWSRARMGTTSGGRRARGSLYG